MKMRYTLMTLGILAAAVTSVCTATIAAAKEPSGSEKQDQKASFLPPIAKSADAAFKRYVDISLLNRAYVEQDAGLLTDVALQLAEGERILLRPHKSASAEDVLQMAIKLAALRGDNASLGRLKKAGTALGKDSIAKSATAALSLSGATRTSDPQLARALEGASKDVVEGVKAIAEQLEAAALLGDTDSIEQAAKVAARLEQLNDAQKAYLKSAADMALKKAATAAADPNTQALLKLTASSRALRYAVVGRDEVFWLNHQGQFNGGSFYQFNYNGTIIRGHGRIIAYPTGQIEAVCDGNTRGFFGAELRPVGVTQWGTWGFNGTRFQVPGWSLDNRQGVTLVR